MPKNINIKVRTSDGKEYPCRVTLGAVRRFKQETGRDADMLSGAADLAVFIWCCCKSACNADGVDFNASLEDFCDRLDMTTAEEVSKNLLDEKKTAK